MKKQAQILIIDDSEDDRDMYRRYLSGDEEVEWEISEAESAEEGLKTFRSEEEPLVLLDYSLPGRSGLDLLRDLKGTNMYAPAVLLTGQGSEIIATECMKLGAQDYLAKGDVTQEGLLRAVHNTMERVTLMRQIDQQREALEVFARLLAHDLKAPIRHIINLNEMIEDAVQQEEYDEIVNFASLAQKAGRRLRQLIDTLGEYNKVDGDIAFEPLAMEDVLRDVLNQLDDAITAKGAEVTHDDLPPVNGNAPQLVQLLQNLIANALKFCNANQPKIHIGVRELGVGLCFSVEDNGIGISAEDAERVFEPFRRLHGQDTYEGTGLGLATCRKIMDRHGGRIWCEPRPEGGTMFSFTLPHPDESDD